MATHPATPSGTAPPATVAAVAFALLALLGTPWPDDWDSVGFVLALERFDLARWQPHAPGYPVYVGLARALHALGARPVSACTLASALGGAALVAALGAHRGAIGLVALASPAVLLAATSARSDALGLGLTALALALPRGPVAGALLALGLGARPSLLPLTLPALVALAPRPREYRAALGAFALVTALWVLGLVHAAGGPGALREALETQARGHLTTWGGTALTHPDPTLRVRWLLRAVLSDGLGIHRSVIGATRALGWCVFLALGCHAAPRRALLLGALALPYGAWVLAGQNLEHSPRHALPLVAALLAICTDGVSVVSLRGRRAGALGVGALVLTALPLAWAHRTQAPAAVQAAGWVRAQGGGVVFGGASTRALSWAGATALPRGWIGEVDVTLERLDALPRRVWVTDEVAFRERGRGALGTPRTFCRAPGIDGAGRCLRLFPYTVRLPEGY